MTDSVAGTEDLVERLGRDIGERLAAGKLTIPLLPTVAAAVIGVVNDPKADMGTLADTIRNDQALAGHVMKFANSPLLRGGAPIVSLQQAITRLGMRQIADVAFAACMGPKLFKAQVYAGFIDVIWNESLATALWSREIARSLRRNVEVSFLCGLLHQIGKPVVLQAVQEVLGPAVSAAPGSAEVTVLLELHATSAGLEVASKWRLPELVAETIGHVRDFRCAPRNPELVAVVAAARAFATLSLQGATPDAGLLAESPEMAEINLYPADIERLLQQAGMVRETLKAIAV
jgi:HD-like signal output (HDOD) protein